MDILPTPIIMMKKSKENLIPSSLKNNFLDNLMLISQLQNDLSVLPFIFRAVFRYNTQNIGIDLFIFTIIGQI